MKYLTVGKEKNTMKCAFELRNICADKTNQGCWKVVEKESGGQVKLSTLTRLMEQNYRCKNLGEKYKSRNNNKEPDEMGGGVKEGKGTQKCGAGGNPNERTKVKVSKCRKGG